MAETMWSEEAPAPKKRRIPTWAWFCGAGCLVALILAIVASVFAVDFFKKSMDPEMQWKRLEAVLPFDERPAGWTPAFGMDMSVFGFEMVTLAGPQREMALLMQLPEQDAEKTREQMFDENFSGSFMGMGGRSEMQKGEIEVQGRTLRVMRFYQGPKSKGGGEGQTGASITVDLTPPGRVRPLILQLIRTGSREPFTDAEIVEFLRPFHVGTER